MQPPSSFTITIFLLFDLSFEYLGIFFYIMIVGSSFTLKLHTWKSSNPHIPNDCDTTTVCPCMFKRIFSGTSSQAGELNTLICTSHSPKSTHFQNKSMLYFYSNAPYLLHSHHTGFHRGIHSPLSPKVSNQSLCVCGHISCTGSTSF